LLIELKRVAKDFGERRLFLIKELRIYQGDRIGIIGANGAGKTTLLKIIAGLMEPDEGEVKRSCNPAYISQLDEFEGMPTITDQALAQQFRVRQFAAGGNAAKNLSGGEKTRCKIAAALGTAPSLLLADEPTANLDIEGIELLQRKLTDFRGALAIICHDRSLLEAVCTAIWEIEAGEMRVYRGGYFNYLEEKERERKQAEAEYDRYINDKKKLEEAIVDREQQARSMRKTPKRMGNSEARLHKMGNQKANANLRKAVNAMKTRLEQLEEKKKPVRGQKAKFDLTNAEPLYNKIILQGEALSKCFGERVLFEDARFAVYNGQKIALVGPNGSGKTTLLKMIAAGAEGIALAPSTRLGYFGQGMEELDPTRSVLANVMETSVYEEGFVRTILARLLFKGEDVYKRVAVMSGGERTRIALARIIAGAANVLLLDEFTNYLDIPSVRAVEAVLSEYTGTVLFACHDRKFIDAVASDLLILENGKLRMFPGNYAQSLEEQSKRQREQEENTTGSPQSAAETMLQKHRLTEVLSRLSVEKDAQSVAQLEREYEELVKQSIPVPE